MKLQRLLVLAVCAFALALPGAAVASGLPHDQVLAALNAERTANGLPSVGENADWSAKCLAHNNFEIANNVFGHTEDPALPGYSDEGNWAGTHAVLSVGDSWTGGDPFTSAPIHLMQIMSPLLTQTGVDDHSDHVCMTTWPGFDFGRFAGQPQTFSYPGDGATGVPAAETAAEMPMVPGDVVGLPAGTTTGFNIMVWAVGLDLYSTTLSAATLTGPDGQPLALKTIDSNDPTVGSYMGPGAAFLIPVSPLAAGTRYTASASFHDGDGGALTRTWSFTTKPAPPPVVVPVLPHAFLVNGQTLAVSGKTKATLRLVLRGPVKRQVTLHFNPPLLHRSFASLFTHLKRGRYTLTVSSSGHILASFALSVRSSSR